MEQREEKLVVSYKNSSYDLTGFLSKHPGGVDSLSGRNFKNIDASFHSVEHSKAAAYLMREYKVDNHDDGMEHLVDWKSAMLPQIARLGEKYHEWVNLPVDRPLRLFESDLLESLSKTPWYLPLLVWTPVIIFLIVKHVTHVTIQGIIGHTAIGVFVWTLLEYNLHRYLFHIDVQRRPRLATFHFLIHGLHHKAPFDECRLVFPPLPAAVLATALYQPALMLHYLGLVAHPQLLLAGGLAGYLCYDMTHYYIHHGDPVSRHFCNLKRKHYYHHFVSTDRGFGISNGLWDRLHGTEILLRRLKWRM